jgi:hypothetical protein
MNEPIFAKYPMSGTHPYKDNPNLGDVIGDFAGAITGGHIGHNSADSFTGSYDLTYTAVARGRNIATVYFTATNVTDLNSLAHPEVTINPAIRSIDGLIPWDAGPLSRMQQTFQWQLTISY